MLAMNYYSGRIEAGCDEAGRGCLAGPVYAAAVILPEDFKNETLNDSKKLTERQRNQLRIIIEREAVSWAVAWVNSFEIDRMNILNASIEAMHRALRTLKVQPNHVLVDGNRFNPYNDVECHCIVRGDATYASIAAASILAKTHRDEYMRELGKEYKIYGWDHNMGYPTQEHREAIMKEGYTPFHRRSFKLPETQWKRDPNWHNALLDCAPSTANWRKC